MSNEKYNLVFKGELVKSFELAQVKQNLSKLFKVTGAKLDALFSGRAVVLKKNLDFDTATKYRVAIKKAGARVDLVEVKAQTQAEGTVQPPQGGNQSEPVKSEQSVKPRAAYQGRAVFGAQEPSQPTPSAETVASPSANPASSSSANLNDRPSAGRAVFGERTSETAEPTSSVNAPSSTASGFGKASFGTPDSNASDSLSPNNPASAAGSAVQGSGVQGAAVGGVEGMIASQVEKPAVQANLAPLGSQIAEPKQETDLPTIDVSAMSLDEVGADLLKADERYELPVMEVDVTAIDLAPAGGDLLKPDEKDHFEEREFDFGGVSIAEVGAQISAGKKEQVVEVPDISRLSLSE